MVQNAETGGSDMNKSFHYHCIRVLAEKAGFSNEALEVGEVLPQARRPAENPDAISLPTSARIIKR